jgi:hypothetical protein
MEAVPVARVAKIVPFVASVAAGTSVTSPLGVPDPLVTETLKVTFCPWLRAVSVAGKVEVIVEVEAL